MIRFNYTSCKWRFLGKTVLHSSVATRLRCGGIVSNHLTTNFLQNPSVKEFRKSVQIRQSYHKKFDGPFFGTQCIYDCESRKQCVTTFSGRQTPSVMWLKASCTSSSVAVPQHRTTHTTATQALVLFRNISKHQYHEKLPNCHYTYEWFIYSTIQDIPTDQRHANSSVIALFDNDNHDLFLMQL